MTPEIQFIKNAMANAAGDDLERAERAFSKCSQEQMNSEYGQSGRTRRQILDEYKAHRQRWNAANDLLRSVIPGY